MATTKGYKVTNPDYTCRGYKYEVGQTYIHKGGIGLCESGFHFCLKPADCFNYYNFNSDNKVLEVEATGEVVHGDDKSVTNALVIIREISWSEMLALCNEGSNNTGLRNTGDCNTGNRNTGNRNTGYSNTGNRNTGDRNTGDRNTGDRNTGDSNTGYSNTGNRNTGDRNTGDRNTGDRNTGDRNTGDRNTGDWNTGDSNTGNRNTGDRNTGYWNTGDSNTGNRNTGYWNTGDRNTGYSNTGNRNTGAFCTGEPDFPMFNKPSDWTETDFRNSRAYSLLCDVDTKVWIIPSIMTEEEKKSHPSWETCDGYLKDIPFKEAFQNRWHNWSEEDRKAFTSLPNFDAKIFEEITGVDVDK